MATEPNWLPVDEEIQGLLDDDLDLVEEFTQFDDAYARGTAELVTDQVVRQMLKAQGLEIAPRDPEEEAGSTAS